MAKKNKIPKTGIKIMVGEPGSGKSYKAVTMILNDLKARRPVYTNIPVKVKTIRAYLSLTSNLPASQVRTLPKYLKIVTKEHFDRFTKRLDRYSLKYEELLNARKSNDSLSDISDVDHSAYYDNAKKIVDSEIGEPILNGGSADWIPVGSSLYLDELHQWYPSTDRVEPKAILSYTSMHRHLMHECTVLSQHAMQVSKSFRRMADEYLYCRDWSKLPFIWFFKLPVKIFRYKTFSSMNVKNGEAGHLAKPTWTEANLPILSHYVIYRLYSSYSHAGNINQLEDEIEKTRAAIEGREPKRVSLMRTKISRAKRLRNFTFKIFMFTVVGVLVLKVGSCGNNKRFETMKQELLDEIQENGIGVTTVTQAKPQVQSKEVDGKKSDGIPTFEITAITKSGAIIDGKFRKFNQYEKEGFRFVGIKEEGRICIFVHEKSLVFMLVDIDGGVKYGLPKQDKKPDAKVQTTDSQPASVTNTDSKN